MTPDELDELEGGLEPTARFVVAYLRQEIAQQSEQLAKLTEQIEYLNRQLFGRRSEKIPTVRDDIRRQLDPNELTVDGEPMPIEPEARAKEKRRKARRAAEPLRKKRRCARKALPMIVETREVQADELPEGYTLDDFRVLGKGRMIQRLEHVREHFVVQRYILQTLASKDGQHIITATTPPGVVDGGHFGPGLHAHIAVTRCDDSMPLCRTAKSLGRAGYAVARSTLGSLFHRVADQLKPIYDELKRVVRLGRYVHADETGQPILDKDKCLRGWMWVILSKQAIVYRYSNNRNSNTAKELLGGTSGNLTIDGYGAYNCLANKEASRVRSGCWGHFRRKVFEAMPVGVTEHENRQVLDMIAELYKLENEVIIAGIDGTRDHLEIRQGKSRAIVNKIWRWIDARKGKHSPASKMGKAISYATKQREKLERFLIDPRLALDNNCAERALRITALGRKNSMFAGSAEHAQNLAMLHTIIATCRLHEVNPYDYIRDMLIRIQTHPASRIAELMPWRRQPPNENVTKKAST